MRNPPRASRRGASWAPSVSRASAREYLASRRRRDRSSHRQGKVLSPSQFPSFLVKVNLDPSMSPRPPKPQATLPLPPPRTPGCNPSSSRAGIGGSPAWRMARERRGARSAGQSSFGRTAWWATWTDTSTIIVGVCWESHYYAASKQ
ncbi:hypothetical protein ACQJBY_033159 [Aegilops geniculata]